jgi:hypothetical protein
MTDRAEPERDNAYPEHAVFEKIDSRIRSAECIPRSPADIVHCAPRFAAIIAEEALRYRDLVRYVAGIATGFRAYLCIDEGMGETKARSEAARLFDTIMAALEEDAFEAMQDDEAFGSRRVRSGSLGHRVLSMLRDEPPGPPE